MKGPSVKGLIVKRLTSYFFQGLVFLVPIAVTLYTFVTLFRWIDRLLPFTFPGLGFVAVTGGVTLVGFLVRHFFTGRVSRLVDASFQRLPLAKLIYGAVKDLLSAFVGEQKRFDVPVLVTLGDGAAPAQVLGFLTAPSLAHLGLADRVAVYLPQAYNFAGQTLIVRASQVERISADATDVMAFIVSGGVTSTAAGVGRSQAQAPARG